jgi:hypothetical protein
MDDLSIIDVFASLTAANLEAVAEAGAQAAIRAGIASGLIRGGTRRGGASRGDTSISSLTADAKDAMPDDESKNSSYPDEEETVGSETTHNLMK